MKMTTILSGAVLFVIGMVCVTEAEVRQIREVLKPGHTLRVVSLPIDIGESQGDCSLMRKNEKILACISVGDKQALQAAVKEVLRNYPEILLDVIEKHAMHIAVTVEQGAVLKAAQEEEKRLMEELANPKNPEIDSSRPIRGNLQGAITIVEYSDFECPYCAAAHMTIKELLEMYGQSVQFIYKHNPLSFHALAEPAARYFEAIALQDPALSWEFHDRVFEQQSELGDEGEVGLQRIAATLSLDLSQLQQDLQSDQISERLAKDSEETQRFGFDGTPAFLVNGVSVMGNRPQEEFVELIRMILAQEDAPDHVVANATK